jgi:hypothetical protein
MKKDIKPDTKQVRISTWAHKKLRMLAIEKECAHIADAIDYIVAFHETHRNELGKPK